MGFAHPFSWEPLAAWAIPLLLFAAALVVALRATAVFTQLLEALGDFWHISPGLLGFISAVGANIPNYDAALTAAAGKQPLVGQQIIVGSNIYNLSIILGIAVLVVPAGRGIVLHRTEARDVLIVARLALAMAAITLFTFLLLASSSSSSSIPARVPVPAVASLVVILITLGLFVLLAIHAFQRQPSVHDDARRKHMPRIGPTALSAGWALSGAVLALAVALGSVVVMVQAGQRFGAAIQMPSALLGLVVLAVATSLPNTVVGYQFARAARVTTGVEEILSSNCVNLALGSALPLLLWPATLHDPLLLAFDTPLMFALTAFLLVLARGGHIPRITGAGLILLYLAWVGLHLAF